MNDYGRVARLIRYLDRHQADQPDLNTLAGEAGLSPWHLHRLFSAWAGVTPKAFLQCLTVAHIRERLWAGQSVLESALEAGLSGPGRLHDLCVKLEAASPGEIKAGGEGWTLDAGVAATPFGDALFAESPRGICHLAFVGPGREQMAWQELSAAWPNARLRRDDAVAEGWATRIFQRARAGRGEGALRAFVRGTAFQVRVWRALLRVPCGALTTYGRLASAIGQPTAARAVGSAVGSNPLGFLIPCHRVIRETGVLGDYRWDPARKRAMVGWEGAVATGAGAMMARQAS